MCLVSVPPLSISCTWYLFHHSVSVSAHHKSDEEIEGGRVVFGVAIPAGHIHQIAGQKAEDAPADGAPHALMTVLGRIV